MEIQNSKVYVLLDERSRVLRCEGGYTMSNIDDVSKWTYIDNGTGDKYNLCQSHYLDGGLYTMWGIPRYKYEDGACVLRSEEEVEADCAALPPTAPTQLDRVEAQVAYTAMMTDTMMEV
nr:MAG TPA: hypothetical protein [Caudoviricetes sp.]